MKSIKIKLAGVLAILTASFFTGTAQTRDTLISTKTMDTIALGNKYMTKWINIQGGYAYMQNAAINQFLAYNVPDLSHDLAVMGISGMMEYNGWIGGFTLQGGMSRPGTVNAYAGHSGLDYKVTNGFYNGMVHLGYAVVNTPRVKLYPIIGIGGGKALAQLTRTNITQAQIANNPPADRNIEIGKGMAYFDLGIGLDFFCPSRMEGNPMKNGGLMIGFKIGYTQGVGVGSWGYNGNNNVIENPNFNPGMFYGKIMVGVFKSHRTYKRF